MTHLLAEGQEAPPFQGTTQTGAPLRLSNLRGRWVVLYFYPKDQTIGCTIEACGFRDEYPQFTAEGAIVLGVSRDNAAAHADFAERRHLPFPLLADPGAEIIGMYGTRRWFGWAKRTTYLIDPEGRIAKVYPRVLAQGHAHRVLEDLRTLRRQRDAARSPQS